MTDRYAPYLFHQGTNYRAFEYLGAHREDDGFVFRVWAPNADEAYVIGSFNNWDMSCPMTRVSEGGIWETKVCAEFGDMYKFRFVCDGRTIDKADPYARFCEKPPATASVLYDTDNFKWNDDGWLAQRASKMTREAFYRQPLNIYELHPGSWKLHDDGSPYSYTELADELAPYVKQMGYTHVELLPVMEHPFSPSWGYQICGYYAPTARFGTPDDFMTFIDRMHTAGIGVILDWVPAHFPKDAHGLYEFDGKPLYEYQGADRMEHSGWGTRRFDVGRNEVECFLVSNAVWWTEIYHADGLRVDAVASMLYLDYDKLPGEWIPNVFGDNRCLEAMAFFKKLNGHMAGKSPDVLMIAEESSAWAHLTGFENDGLGFSLKWNMGWMHDALDYIGEDPLFRKFDHNRLTFSLTYSFSEKYLLPISHDEVVHGKKSLLDRMWGDYWQKFATDRIFAVYMMTHPGKKLTFMGNEIGQFREWDDAGQIEWFLLDYDSHARFQLFSSELNHLYLEHHELWELDGWWDGFQWINADDSDNSVYSYRRIAENGDELIVLLNFTPVAREGFTVGVPSGMPYREILNSDDKKFGGSGVINPEELVPVKPGMNGLDFALTLTLPPLGAVILKVSESKEAQLRLS